MTRTARIAFALVAVAAVGGLYVAQRLRHSEPVVLGVRRTAAFSPTGLGPRHAAVSFYLKRSDTAAVSVVDIQGDQVRSISPGTKVGARRRVVFVWDGRDSAGEIPADGTYRFRIGLARQGRSLTVPNGVRLDTKPAQPVVTRVLPAHGPGPLILPGPKQAVGVVSGTPGHDVEGFILRTDISPAKVVRRFRLPDRPARITWDGKVNGRPAVDGTYLLGLTETDSAGNRGSTPQHQFPVAGPTRGRAGVTVRHLGVAVPQLPARPGGIVSTRVDARGRDWTWSLAPALGGKVLKKGKGRGNVIRLRVPLKARGLLTLAVAAKPYRVEVPIGVETGRRPLLVVLPAIRWQALAPVDATGDGLPDWLELGRSVALGRLLPPLSGGLNGLNSQVTPLLRALAATGLAYDVTTDIALTKGRGPRLEGHRGVVLAGEETWLTEPCLKRLRERVIAGGRLLDLGIDALRRTVVIKGDVVSAPSRATEANALGAVISEPSVSADYLLQWKDDLGLFATIGGRVFAPVGWRGTSRLIGSTKLLSAAGPQSGISGIAAWRLGKGVVIRPGIPGMAALAVQGPTALAVLSRALVITAGR
ncbi:unannotated protein [freshwater metagenome]|uniref:Unannotated protein n=1 Tax=freshwater metagenome TaxID=449393 RepID=A0A6J7DP54_9ZZZZ